MATFQTFFSGITSLKGSWWFMARFDLLLWAYAANKVDVAADT